MKNDVIEMNVGQDGRKLCEEIEKSSEVSERMVKIKNEDAGRWTFDSNGSEIWIPG